MSKKISRWKMDEKTKKLLKGLPPLRRMKFDGSWPLGGGTPPPDNIDFIRQKPFEVKNGDDGRNKNLHLKFDNKHWERKFENYGDQEEKRMKRIGEIGEKRKNKIGR